MAKTKISEWSSTPANNTDIDSINIAEGCAPSGINDAIRELMSQVKDLYSGTTGDAIGIAGGGTGQVTATAAFNALAPSQTSNSGKFLTTDGTNTSWGVAGASLTTPSFTTTIGVGNATASASGAGVTFPATQSASSDANTLDDYEEGTWTPSVTLNSGTATTYTIGTATYTKTGRMVVVIGSIIPTNGTLGFVNGYARITGLPFTVATRSGAGSGGNISALNGSIAATFAYSTTLDATFTLGVASTNEFAFVATYFV